jgi:tetratricopeptide (TPR) repeat protein
MTFDRRVAGVLVAAVGVCLGASVPGQEVEGPFEVGQLIAFDADDTVPLLTDTGQVREPRIQGNGVWRVEEIRGSRLRIVPAMDTLPTLDGQPVEPRFAKIMASHGGWVDASHALSLDRAEARLTEVIGGKPTALLHVRRMAIRWAQERWEGALEDASAAIRLEPDEVAHYLRRARILMGLGRVRDGLEDLDEAVRVDSSRIFLALWTRARVRLDRGDFDGAIADYETLLQHFPLDPQHLQARARAMRARDAKAGIVTPQEPDPEAAGALAQAGQALFRAKDYSGALGVLDDAVWYDPSSRDARMLRGATRALMSDEAGAMADCDVILRDRPDDLEALRLRGIVRAHRDDLEGAIADASRVLDHDPNDVKALLLRGSTLERASKHEKAQADFERAIRVDPSSAEAHEALALLLATCDDPKFRDGARAVESAQRACELSGEKDADHLVTLGMAYARAGAFDRAIKAQEKANAIAADPEERRRGDGLVRLYRSKSAYPPDPSTERPLWLRYLIGPAQVTPGSDGKALK